MKPPQLLGRFFYLQITRDAKPALPSLRDGAGLSQHPIESILKTGSSNDWSAKEVIFVMPKKNTEQMKIAIIGYGKMGKMIESIAREKGHTIGSCIDIDNQELLEADSLAQHDVAIEFTRPETARQNISKCLDAGVPVVSGTTGWTDELESIMERCRKENGSLLAASNFSLGVNILFHLNLLLS